MAPDAATGLPEAIRSAYEYTLARAPLESESSEAEAFIRQQTESYAAMRPSESRELALADFCQVLMCLNEFAYID